MNESLKILLIDDDDTDCMVIRRLFERSKLQVILEEAENCKEAVEKIKTQEFDCALVDYYLPDGEGAAVMDQLHAVEEKEIPLIVLTGMGNENMAAEV
ncbi:MAG: response regulator, partial [Nitrospinae bacterium]|nr:response regulator [Nitrospinota bacterium]